MLKSLRRAEKIEAKMQQKERIAIQTQAVLKNFEHMKFIKKKPFFSFGNGKKKETFTFLGLSTKHMQTFKKKR